MAEAMPDECALCINTNAAVCYNAGGCGASWSCYAGCVEASCAAMGPFSDCAQASCAAELMSWSSCVASSSADCTAAFAGCAR